MIRIETFISYLPLIERAQVSVCACLLVSAWALGPLPLLTLKTAIFVAFPGFTFTVAAVSEQVS